MQLRVIPLKIVMLFGVACGPAPAAPEPSDTAAVHPSGTQDRPESRDLGDGEAEEDGAKFD